MDEELQCLKLEADLVEYAVAQGYHVDRRESGRSSLVLRRDRDKIVVAKGKNGAWIYFSVRDERDRGTIIDFIQHRTGWSLGRIRQELRQWVGKHQATGHHRFGGTYQTLHETHGFDRTRITQALAAMWICDEHPYLLLRGITRQTQTQDRFRGQILADSRGNAVFPHRDGEEACGFEVKNRGFNGFSPGGRKGLWVTNNWREAPRIVITESGIDALSHAQLMGDVEAAYISIGGAMGTRQKDLLREFLGQAKGRVIAGTDSDEAGEKLAAEIVGLVSLVSGVERARPKMKDWNDVLRLSCQPYQSSKQH